jgi:GT2 family glycosyltransferase
MEIAVIIVSYNTRDLLHNALHSVYAAQRPSDFTLSVVVVDNASHDGSAEMVNREFPQATLIASPENLGFTGGNNLALATLGFDVEPPTHAPTTPVVAHPPTYVWLLNPDTEIAPDALLHLVRFMDEHPDAGMCGARLHYGNGAFQHGAFRFPTLAQIALDFFPLTGVRGIHRLHNSRVNGRYPQSAWQGAQPFRVDFVLGASMFVRGAAIQQIGALDDAYFMYCEEMDWAMRFEQAGWRLYALPAAHVAHLEGQSSRQRRWDSYERLWRSRFRFFTKHNNRYSPGFRLAARLLVRLGSAWRARQAHQRFANGESTGEDIARELKAYATITRF